MNATSGSVTAKSNKSKKRVAVVSLGCAKNLVNSEQMMFLLNKGGYETTGETEGADVVIVNTCGFIDSAKEEAIETILEFGRAKTDGRIGRLIVAGCLPQLYKNEIMREMPEIDAVVGVGSFDDILEVVEAKKSSEEQQMLFGDIDAAVSETGRILTTSPAWAYLKISEGCDNRCAYCVIPEIRGRYRSRSAENVVSEAKELAGRGIKELILVAQDVTGYGQDIYGERRLPQLLRSLSGIEELEWIRLHYLYPHEIEDGLISVIANEEKILKYIDMPIQHINDGILKRMNRRGSGSQIRELVKKVRERIPGAVIRTSVITGLPGEGEAEFEELCEFLLESRIERAGVFAYSPQEGTPAAGMERADQDTARRRADLLADIQLRIMDEYNESRIGSETTVLIEGNAHGGYFGRSYAESPDADGYISVRGKGIKTNEFARVRLTGVENNEPAGISVREKKDVI